MARHAYALYAIFLVKRLLNSNILKNYDGKIETSPPKLFSSNHCIRRDDARRELGTAPNIKNAVMSCLLSKWDEVYARSMFFCVLMEMHFSILSKGSFESDIIGEV